MSSEVVQTAKFLGFVLRHQPEAIGLALDAEGWGSVGNLTSQRSLARAAALPRTH